jgi:hypothetical protein
LPELVLGYITFQLPFGVFVMCNAFDPVSLFSGKEEGLQKGTASAMKRNEPEK